MCTQIIILTILYIYAHNLNLNFTTSASFTDIGSQMFIWNAKLKWCFIKKSIVLHQIILYFFT